MKSNFGTKKWGAKWRRTISKWGNWHLRIEQHPMWNIYQKFHPLPLLHWPNSFVALSNMTAAHPPQGHLKMFSKYTINSRGNECGWKIQTKNWKENYFFGSDFSCLFPAPFPPFLWPQRSPSSSSSPPKSLPNWLKNPPSLSSSYWPSSLPPPLLRFPPPFPFLLFPFKIK